MSCDNGFLRKTRNTRDLVENAQMRSGTCIPIQKPLPSPNACSCCGQVAEEQAAAAAAAALGGQAPAGNDASAAAAEHDGDKSSGDGGADGGGEEGETSGLTVVDTSVEGITSALAAAKVAEEEDGEERGVDVRAEAEADVLGSQSALTAAKVADEEEEVGQEVEDGGGGDADAGVPGITAALAATALGEHEPTNPNSPAWQPAPPGAAAADRRGDRGGAGVSALGLSWSGAEPDPDAQDAAEVAGEPDGPPRVLHGTHAAAVVAAEMSESAGEVAGGEVTSGDAGEPAQDPYLDLNRSRRSRADAAADSVAAAAEQLRQVALGAGAPTLDTAVKPEPDDQACGLPAGPPPAARSAGRRDCQYGRPTQSKENRRVTANAGGGGGGAADGGRRGATPVGKPKATPKAGAGVSSGVAAMRSFWEQASAAKPAGGPAGGTSRKGK